MRRVTEISAKRRRFAEEYVLDGNATAAAIRAGYSTRSAHVTACRMLKDPDVQAALAERQAELQERLELDRQRVISEIMAAIGVARMKADPQAMIKGWAEIAKMLGYYEPERCPLIRSRTRYDSEPSAFRRISIPAGDFVFILASTDVASRRSDPR